MDVKSAKQTKKGLAQKKPIDEDAQTDIVLNIRQQKRQPAQDRLKRLQASLKQKADKKKLPKKAKNSSTSPPQQQMEPLPTQEKNSSMGNLNAAALHKMASKPKGNVENTSVIATSKNSKRNAAVEPKRTPQGWIRNKDNLNAAALHKHFNRTIAAKPISNLDNTPETTISQNSKRKTAVKPKPTPHDSIGNMDNTPPAATSEHSKREPEVEPTYTPQDSIGNVNSTPSAATSEHSQRKFDKFTVKNTWAKPKALCDASSNLGNIRLGSATRRLNRLRQSLRRQQHSENMECQRRIHEIIYGEPLNLAPNNLPNFDVEPMDVDDQEEGVDVQMAAGSGTN